MTVPFLNLHLHHEPLREELRAAFDAVIDDSAFAGGTYVTRFEEEFARFCGVTHACGVSNGTEALWFALLALGIRPGDEVITVPSTFIATAEAISYCGATPVFVDIDDETYTLDAALLERAVTPRTKAIVPVHLFGQVADMEPIMEVAHRHGLPVIEDACQAHGAQYKGRLAGVFGDMACFSFHPSKNLGALGEAGAVLTSNSDLKQKLDMLRDHGQAEKYHHSLVGWNGRMDGVQAAMLSLKLKRLEAGNARRRHNAHLYHQLLDRLENLLLPTTGPERLHSFHIYAVRAPRRDDLMRFLAGKGIGSGIHYPVPIHLQPAYAHLGLKRGSFPVSERCAGEFLSLPIFPELTFDQIAYVCDQIAAWSESRVALQK